MDRLNKSTSANCADKRKKQRSRFSSMCFFILLHCAFVAKADEWSFQASGTFDVSSDKTFTGSVDVGSNTLTLNVINSVVFLRNYSKPNTSMFQISNGGKLVINGEDGKVVTFNGNFDIDNVYNNGLPDSYGGPRSGAAIYIDGTSTVELHYVDFTNFLCNRRNGGNHAGVINFFNSDNDNNGSATFDHINFYKCYAGIPRPTEPTNDNDNKWGRIINIQSGTWNITMTNSSIRHCYINEPYSSNTGINGMGGAIRSQGNVGGILRLTDCAFEDNLYYDRYTGELAGQGGVINWRSGNNTGSNPAHLIIKDCRFVRNKAKQGGAIATNAKITIERNTTDPTKYTYISKNEAVEGGGIYFWTYNGGQASYDGDGFDAILGDVTLTEDSDYLRIYDNYARDFGGGVYITIDPSKDVGFNSGNQGNQPISPNFYVRFYKGCSVSYNRSPKGAGVAIIDNAGNMHYNGAGQTPANTWSGVYNRHIYFDGSKVENNKTLLKNGEAVPSEVAGGGIYISKQRSPDASFSNDFDDSTNGGGGLLTVDLVSGTCSGNNAVAGTFVLNDHFYDDQGLPPFDDSETGTSPGYGGGYYIASLFEGTVNSTLNVNIGEAGKNLQIYDNQAYTDGGGVYVFYDRTNGRLNQGTVTVANGTIGKIDKTDPENPVLCPNKALHGNGGGICVMGGTVFVNGGNIEYNTAANGLGGGVYVSVPNDLSTTVIQGGANISHNSAMGGGGVYVDKGELDVFGNRWNNTTGEWEMLDWANPFPGASSEKDHTRITKNTATDGNGGGINAGNGEVDIFNTLIWNNTSSGTVSKGRGGGVYLDGGIIKIYNSKILNNTAETNGGGIDDHSGDIEIYGGDISHNTATNGRGGGIYTNAGDIRIWPTVLYGNPVSAPSLDACKNTGTLFSYNKAGTNGGGLNTHIGRLDVRFANVHHNEAGTTFNPSTGAGGGNGGGMFCEGPQADLSGYTVRLLHTYLNDNKAYGNGSSGNELTGRGGGLYLKYGSIFAEHCDILRNEADFNGGGLDNHDGELRVYGSFVNHNKAKKGRGGGLYTDKGNLVVGPCDSYGFTESKASRICNNTAYLNGGGINNHEGNITIHGDRINNNTATTGKGGGVYINSGNIYMYGGQINNNHADDPSGGYGGGVYGGGGTFNIMEREAHPILEILEVENITTDGFTVHFHHVDRGYALEQGARNKEYGIAFSVNPYPLDLGENEYWGDNWQGVDTVKVGPTNGIPFPAQPHTYNQNEGCSRFVVNSTTSHITINPNTTYYVVAYGKYTYDGKDYFDASPVVTVTTYGTLPVVVTGVAFDVTATSASVNAKQFYAGNPALTQRGIEISSDGGSNWTPYPSSSVGDVFSVVITGLSSNATYKARAYATNSIDTGYGSEIEFTTSGNGGGKAAEGNYPKSIYPSVEENPFFMELTPLQQAILASTPEADTTVQHPLREAKDDPTPADTTKPVDIPEINYNTATYGGGVCIDKQGAKLIFAGSREAKPDKLGQINENYASEAGGGIYIGKESADEYAKMQMMGKCEVNENHVPAGKHGGGIYLDGRLYVGDKDTDPIGTHGLKVDNNWAVDGAGAGLPNGYAANGKLNNVFLTRYEYEYNANATEAGDNKVSVITLLSDISGYAGLGNTNPYSSIGFSVIKGFCPVIATSEYFSKTVENEEIDGNFNLHNYTPTGESASVSTETWLRNLMIMSGVAGGTGTADALTGAVFEDSESYVAVHTQTDIAPFRSKFIYLWGCWTHPVVKEDPEKDTGPESDPDQSMVGTGKHYKITKDANGILTWEIYSPEGLSWFSSYVNGLNVFDERTGGDDKHDKWKENINPYAKAKIMNDLDMSAYLWVPIGAVKYFFINSIGTNQGSLFVDSETPLTIESHTYSDNHKYKGSFDGQGHIITGLQGLYLTGIRKFGLFGYLDDGAEVKNTFVDESHFVSDDKTVIYSAGGIAGKMAGGVLSNSEARMSFDVGYSADGTAVGGLVGEIKGGDVHSSMAMPSIFGQNKGKPGTNPAFNAFQGYMGGLVGKLGEGCSLKNSFSNVEITLIDTEGASVEAEEHSRFLGGIAGENNGLIENVYVRYQGTTPPEGFGWFAGKNNYTAAGETTPEAIGTIRYCYAPRVADDESYDYADFNYIANPIENSVLELQANYGATKLESGKYGFKHRDQQMTENADNGYIVNDVFLGGLLPTLNNWVETANTPATPDPGSKEGEPTSEPKYSTWTRTMASTINDDYPVLMFNDFNVVGTEDGIYMKYDDNVNDMWKKPNYESLAIAERTGKDFQSLTSYNNPKAAMYLYKTNGVTATNSTPVAINVTGNTAVRLHIHENVGITQTDGAELHARVGVTIKNKANADAPNWHLFSSSINGVPMGIRYRTAEDNTNMNMNIEGYGMGTYKALIVDKANASGHNDPYHPESVWSNRAYFDPPMIEWYQSDNASQTATYFPNKVGYFPTNTPYGTWRSTYSSDFFDLYAYSEEFYHWVNFKREGSSTISDHWHMDRDEESNHWRLNYGFRDESGNFTLGNEPTLLNGKGYLLDLSSESMLMADGTLNTGNVSTWTTNTPVGTHSPTFNGYDAPWREINLIGNPYQSFLDFDEFAKANMPTGSGTDAWKNVFYATRDDNSETSRNGYIYYVPTQSENKQEYTASRYIHPHQGFFVKVTGDGALNFNDNMRVAGTSTSLISPYRDRLNYPLVNLLCYDDNGDCDLTIVEVNRPEFGGGQKMKKLHSSNGMIYARLEDRDFQVLFTPMGTNTVPVRFEAAENGHFTLRWNTLHGDFSYLHLIDNITGMDIDCLTTDEYKFEGKTTDYKSRFKLVFDCTGIDEPEDDGASTGSATFAFQMDDELIVNGEGMLQLFDLNGRCLMTKQAVGQQSSVSIPQVAAGMYLLRLTSNKQVRVQKMIIK